MRRLLALALVSAVTPAHADGLYVSQSLGVGIARGDLEPTVGRAMRTRLGIGARVRWLAIEPWLQSDVQTSRDGARLAIIGGDPAAGRADLATYGVDAKLIAPLYDAPDGTRLEAYVRGGPFLASAEGALAGYDGYGAGVGTGIQLIGKVRALGFVWTPLFFTKRGPKVTGALYLDHGFEWVRLRNPDRMQLDARVGHVTVGFGVGSTF